MNLLRTILPRACALALPLVLSACGGGSGGAADSAEAVTAPAIRALSQAAIDRSFPVGLSLSAPINQSSMLLPSALLSSGVPSSGVGRLESVLAADAVEGVLHGQYQAWMRQPAVGDLFHLAANAGCYGRPVLYFNHDNATRLADAAGLTADGDVALWQSRDDFSGRPCVAAQLSDRSASLSVRSHSALTMAAILRAESEVSGVVLKPGDRTDLSRLMAYKFPGVTVRSASHALGLDGVTNTYRLALAEGGTATTGGRIAEVVLQHKGGVDSGYYDGTLRITGFTPYESAGFGVDCHAVNAQFQQAQITTVRYRRRGTEIDFGARAGVYCGAPSGVDGLSYSAGVATLTPSDELDPSVRIRNSALEGRGWLADFERYAGRYDRNIGSGSYLYAWQESPNDSHARAIVMHSSYDANVDAYNVQGNFAFTSDIAGSGDLLGMVCNWAGPGAVYAVVDRFQSQKLTLARGATGFAVTDSRIAYAPTNSCNSVRTNYDANGDGMVPASEGVGYLNQLDVKTTQSWTVEQEVEARGFARPGYF